MTIMPIGDYYVWYCERCDTRNMTIWTRFENGVACGGCQMKIDSVMSAAEA